MPGRSARRSGLQESLPDTRRLPDPMQVDDERPWIFAQYISAISKEKSGDAHVRCAMNEHGFVTQVCHRSTELCEVFFGRVSKIDRDVCVLDSERLEGCAFIGQRILRVVWSEVDHVVNACVLDVLKLPFCGLPTREDRVADRQEVEYSL